MIELQHKLMGDTVRNDAFYKALKQSIQKGKTTVSDIGSGTGFLSFISRRLGAQQCYLYECDEELLALSAHLAKQNKITKLTFVPGYSLDIAKPPRTDVIVCETLGNFALEEHILETLKDAHRFMNKGAVMIPEAVTQYVAPVVTPRIHNELTSWDSIGYDLSFKSMRDAHLNNMIVYKIGADELLQTKDAAVEWDKINFYNKDEPSVRSGKAQWKIPRDTTIYGLALWWDAQLIKGINLSTSPSAPATHWEQIYLPLSKPLTAKKGSTVQATLTSDTRLETGIELAWQVGTIKMDSRKGMR